MWSQWNSIRYNAKKCPTTQMKKRSCDRACAGRARSPASRRLLRRDVRYARPLPAEVRAQRREEQRQPGRPSLFPIRLLRPSMRRSSLALLQQLQILVFNIQVKKLRTCLQLLQCAKNLFSKLPNELSKSDHGNAFAIYMNRKLSPPAT